MVTINEMTKANSDVRCDGQTVLVCGGTQGIGAGVAERFAKGGARLIIVGRSEQKAKEALERLESANPNSKKDGEHVFLKADLSDVAQIKELVGRVREVTKGKPVDHVFLTQGGPPLEAMEPQPSNGVERSFAIQTLSRFAVAYHMTEGKLVSQSITCICAPGRGSKGSPVDVDDIDMLKANARGEVKQGIRGVLTRTVRTSAVLDSFNQTMAERLGGSGDAQSSSSSLYVCHLYPGAVSTDVFDNVPSKTWLSWALHKYLTYFAVRPGPGGYAESPFYLIANEEGRRQLHKGRANLFDAQLNAIPLSPSVEESDLRQAIWDKLRALVE